jgi:hypothetical protein
MRIEVYTPCCEPDALYLLKAAHGKHQQDLAPLASVGDRPRICQTMSASGVTGIDRFLPANGPRLIYTDAAAAQIVSIRWTTFSAFESSAAPILFSKSLCIRVKRSYYLHRALLPIVASSGSIPLRKKPFASSAETQCLTLLRLVDNVSAGCDGQTGSGASTNAVARTTASRRCRPSV